MTPEEIDLENKNWRTLLGEEESESVAAVNGLLQSAKDARDRGNPEPARLLAALAMRLGYHYAKSLGLYVEMKRMKGHSLIKGGWHEGTFYAVYGSGDKVYDYPGLSEDKFMKLCASPFPDRLWAGYRKQIKEVVVK